MKQTKFNLDMSIYFDQNSIFFTPFAILIYLLVSIYIIHCAMTSENFCWPKLITHFHLRKSLTSAAARDLSLPDFWAFRKHGVRSGV